MIEWFTAQKLAGIASMPTSDRRVRARGQKEGWISRPRTEGKGLEYHISSLPLDVQDALKSDFIHIPVESSVRVKSQSSCLVEKQNSLAEFNTLSSAQKSLANAKLAVLTEISHVGLSAGIFVEKYNNQEIQLSEEIRRYFPTLRKTTVYLWQRTYLEKGLSALASKRGQHRKNTGVIDQNQDIQSFIIGMVVEYPHISNTVLFKAIKSEFVDQDIPSLRTLERWLGKWKKQNKQVFCAINSPDEWKNRYMQAFGSGNEHITELNQLWEFDSTPADLMLKDGRHTIIGVIDVYTRRIKFVVSRTSNSKGVAQVIRQAIIDWGIPQIAKTDNGSDYKSNYIKSVFDALDIRQEFCPPFQAWKKPHIERVFRSFSHDILELLDGYIGHNVADRKQIESRKQFSDRLFKKDTVIDVNLSSEELQAFCDNWIDNEYHIRVHSELKKTPLEMVRDWKGDIYRIENERVLDILLSEPAGTRVVGKKGISLEGGTYIHPELGAIIGDEVRVFYDDHDMGRIYVQDMNGEFVCIAEDPEVTGVSRKEVAQKTKEVQREAVQEEKRRLKAAAKKISKRDIANEILAHQAQKNLEENTLAFPRPSQTHISEGLKAAAEALAVKEGKNQSGLSDEFKDELTATQSQLKGQLIQPAFARKAELPTDPAAKYNYWLELDKKVKAGLEIEEHLTGFYKTFPRSAEYEGGKMLAALRQQTASK